MACKSIKGENEIIKRIGDSVIEFLDEIKLYRGLENPGFNSKKKFCSEKNIILAFETFVFEKDTYRK